MKLEEIYCTFFFSGGPWPDVYPEKGFNLCFNEVEIRKYECAIFTNLSSLLKFFYNTIFLNCSFFCPSILLQIIEGGTGKSDLRKP